MKTHTTIIGKVIPGNKLGREIGFPTANIRLDENAPIEDGVYAALIDALGETYEGMLNVGRKPTVGGDGKRSAEVHLFGFDGNLYGLTIQVTPLKFMRPEEKFSSLDELRRQIEADKEEILKYFSGRHNIV